MDQPKFGTCQSAIAAPDSWSSFSLADETELKHLINQVQFLAKDR
jgi:hypothetical protein